MTCEFCGEETEADLCEECAEGEETKAKDFAWSIFRTIKEKEPESDGFELD